MIRTILPTITSLLLFFSCSANESKENEKVQRKEKTNVTQGSGLKEAYFASGCFWCVEHIYENVEGVEEAISGFAGGKEMDPTYREVAGGGTGHAETVKVLYDPEKVSFNTLVKVYYASQDPTTVGQAPDLGPQYRSIIFYTNEKEKRIAQEAKDSVASSGEYDDPIVTEIKPLKQFYPAKEYHQDYVEKHPNRGYVRQVSIPRYEDFTEQMPEVLK